MASIFFLHRQGQLPAMPPAEGVLYPLLRRVWRLQASVVTGPFSGYSRSGNTLTASANGAFPNIDSVTMAVNDVFLLDQGVSAVDNGLYTITNLGSVSTPWTATRSPDFDSQAEAVPGTVIKVREGTSGTGKLYRLTNATTPVINTDNVDFAEDGSGDLAWAFAVPKAATTGSIEARRKNRLTIATLRALGFELDPNNAQATVPFDFYYLHGRHLIEPFPASIFDATLPPLDDNGAAANELILRDPTATRLQTRTGEVTMVSVKLGAEFAVDKMECSRLSAGQFDLGASGSPTSPTFDAKVTLEEGLQREFPNGVAPTLTFVQTYDATDGDGELTCNSVPVVASNTFNPGGGDVTIAADTRHDRREIDVATLVCLTPDTDPALAVEVFPAISFQPNSNLPLTVSIANDGVSLRLPPRNASLEPTLTVRRFRPCVRVTVRGPVIHADASATGALETMRLLEPAERKFEETVEQINDFLVYSFEVCLPVPADQLNLLELLRLERLALPLRNWPNITGLNIPTLRAFLDRLMGGISLPRFGVFTPLQVKFDLTDLALPGVDPFAHLNFPPFANIPAWKAHLRQLSDLRFDDPNLELPIISSPSLSGMILTVNFSVSVDADVNFAFAYPDIRRPSLTLPDFGLPALTEYDFRVFDVTDLTVKVTFPDLGVDLAMLLPTLGKFWTVRIKRPGGIELDLKVDHIVISGLDVTFTLAVGQLTAMGLQVNVDLVRVKWTFAFSILSVPDIKPLTIKLTTPFPAVRLPLVERAELPPIFDFRLLKLRARLDGVTLGTFNIRGIPDFDIDNPDSWTTIELDVPKIGDAFPDLEFLRRPNVTLDFALDLTLPLTKCFLTDLLGDLGSVDFRLSVPTLPTPRFNFDDFFREIGNLTTPQIALELIVRVPHPTQPKFEWDELKLVLGLRVDLFRFQLADNRIYFFLPQRRSFDSNLAPRQAFDFDIFTLTFPNRPEPLGFPVEENHDGYLDLTAREFVIDLRYPDGKEPTPPPRIHAYFPGGMDREGARLGREGVENLKLPKKDSYTPIEQAQIERYRELHKEYTKRFDLELDTVDPKLWPATGPERLMFRFNSKGLTFAANLGKTEVVVDSSGFDDEGEADENKAGLIKPFKCQPQEKLRELKSRLVVIDNELKEAGVYAKAEVPGVDNLIAEVSVVLRQRKKGMLPDVLASMELERADGAPLAELSMKLLELSLDRIEMGLIWRREEKEWDYSIVADGTIGFTGAAALVPDLEGLRAPSIQVLGLDLRRLSVREMRVPLPLVKPVRFDILDGMFGVELGDLELGWEFVDRIPRPKLLTCELAKLTYKNPGALEVSVTVGGLHIEFDPNLKAHVKLPSSLGIEVALGTTARFAGRVGWVETDIERYLFASGKLMLEGLPEIRGLLKFGTGQKLSGRREINVVLYGEQDYDEQLFAGAVVKSLGLGVGLNNRLAAIPPSPSADAILRRIDLVKPGELEGWKFVEEGGFYLSVIGTVTLASNLGDEKVLNAYVAALVVSFDTNFDLVAAGKCWLSCSVKGMRDNPNNPAFIGAMVLSPRQRKLELVLESRKNAYVEQNDLIKKLLDKGKVRFAFRMTPQLVDFHLAELSYADQMFGVQMVFTGEYRFAIFKRAVLLKNELSATGTITRSMNAGPGGFDLDGKAALQVGYGGLLSDKGAMAYAFLDASIRFRVRAWIEIGFSLSFRVCGKRFTISWSVVFNINVPQLELTFRGYVAVADRGGLVSVDCQVGINVVICSYRLRASARLSVNPDLYQEVRAQVAAFEQELEDAINKLDNSGSSTFRLLAAAAPRLLAAQSSPPPEESWLLYSRDASDESMALLLPKQDGLWLTPTIATINSIEVTGGELGAISTPTYAGALRSISVSGVSAATSSLGRNGSFDVAIDASGTVSVSVQLPGENYQVGENLIIAGTSLPGGATPADDITFRVTDASPLLATFDVQEEIGSISEAVNVRLLGLRGGNVPTGLNGVWRATVRDGTVTLRVRDFLVGRYEPLIGGVWYVQESVQGLEPEQHDTVPYLHEVERAVLRTSDWLTIDSFAGGVATIPSHGITGKVRVVMRRNDTHGTVVDPNPTRNYDSTDLADLTLRAISESDTTLRLSGLNGIEPAAGWQLATALEIAPPWSARNRLAAFRETFSTEDYTKYTGAAAAWAETAKRAGKSDPLPVGGHGYAVVFDERFASADPRFSPPDAPTEPGVLSTRFRPIDDVDIVGADAVLEAARRYVQASADVARQELHGALDLDESETLQQARAQSTQLLVHRLSDRRGPQRDERFEAPVSGNNDKDREHEIRYGWFCVMHPDTMTYLKQHSADPGMLFVRRAGAEAKGVPMALPGSAGSVDEVKPKPLPIRQEFVIDDASDVRERGRVVVKLAVRYNHEVLRRRSQDIGRVQIYRQVGDGPEELIGDQLRPEVSYLDVPQVYSRSRQLFVNTPTEITDDYLFSGSVTIVSATPPFSRLTLTGDQVQLLPAGDSHGDLSKDPIVGYRCLPLGLSDYFTITNVVTRTVNELTVDFAPTNGPAAGPLTFSLTAAGLIVPRAVLFSDEFPAVDREFESAELRAVRGAGRLPTVRYSLRLMEENDPGGPIAGSRLYWEEPVPLFVPERTPPMPQLALAVPVASLIESAAYGVEFQLIDLSGETPQLATRDGVPLRADEFEFWIDGDILRQTGFFAGETVDATPRREVDGERVTLADVRTTGDFESTAGKLPVKTKALDPSARPVTYQFTDSADSTFEFDSGTGFRAFLRPKGDTTVRSLRRLPIVLVRELPTAWDTTVRYRIVDTVEIVPDAHVARVRGARADAILTDFSADDRYDAGRAGIRVVWPSQSLLDGGVELQFRDFDDSSMRSRTLVEVLEAEEFAESQPDFRDDSFWTPRPTDRLEHYVSRVVAKADVPTDQLVKDIYSWKRTVDGRADKIDAIRRLEEAKKIPAVGSDWSEFAEAARKIQTALLSYEKSPLFLNRVETRQCIELLRLAFRSLVVGNKVGTLAIDGLAHAKNKNQELLEQITQIEQKRAETVSDSGATEYAFLDRDTARKLAGIVRRRLAIADEVVSQRRLDSFPNADALAARSNNHLVREEAWMSILADAESMSSQLVMTNELKGRFGGQDDARDLCVRLIDRLIHDLETFDLEKYVPRAAGLSELLYRLDLGIREGRERTPAAILKRPHHELTTTRAEDGSIVPSPVALRRLLPTRAQDATAGAPLQAPDEGLERLGIRTGQVATLSANGHVTLWTTRAKSVRTEAMVRVQHFKVEAVSLAGAGIALEEVAEGPRLLITADFGSGFRAQLWDASRATKLRAYEGAPDAVFAATPRGLEVALVRNSRVVLETTDAYDPAVIPPLPLPRTPLEFMVGEETAHFAGPVAYHDEIRVLAAVRGHEIVFWRDFGRPANDIPFRRFSLANDDFPTATATHIQPITLPAGAGFIVAATGYSHSLFFIDPLPIDPTLINIQDGSVTISELSVDRRELTASVVIGSQVKSYDLLDPTNTIVDPPATKVAILHGRENGDDQSYVVVPSGGNVGVWFWDKLNRRVDRLQTLPEQKALGGSDDAGNVIAVTARLMTARSAVASADVLSLFHLWERMGFSLDIAAQDHSTRLLTLTELREKVRLAVEKMSSLGHTHYVYVVEGEEPDAEFRDDRVGFSHVNVAVVPEEFLAACLEPNLVALEKWLENRAITVTPAEREAELAYIVHLTRLVGVPQASRLGVVENEPENADGDVVPYGGTLRVQPRSERFVKVPASAGFSHWSWTLPDRKGHRMLVAARSVSRYEQLLRWWLNLHTRFDLAEEVALKRTGSDETIHTVQAPSARDSVTLASPLEPNTGWQPLRIEVVAGTGAGQRREVVEIAGSKLSIDPGDPWQPALVASNSQVKIFDAAPGWRLVTLDAIHDPVRGEGARPLMVYQYPHSRRPRFSYQIPLDGMRATYNQISRVRTGYHGIEAAFRYFLSDRIDGGDAPTLNDLLAGILADAGATVTPPDRTVIAVKSGAEPTVRLFRHERLVSLPGLPFFYRYRLDVRSAYKARRLESDRATAADRLPDDENASPPARRLPACLGVHDVQAIHPVPVKSGPLPADQPAERNKIRVAASGAVSGKDPLPNEGLLFRARLANTDWGPRIVVKTWADGVVELDEVYPESLPTGREFELTPHEYELTLLASANRDHLTREESASEPQPVKVPLPDLGDTVAARDLPDFFMEYQLAIRQPDELKYDDLPSRQDLFISAGSIRLPWSPGFRPPLGFSPALPLVSLSSGLAGRRDYAVIPASMCADVSAFKAAVEAQLGDTWESASTFEIRPLGADQSFQFKTTTAGSLQDAARGWQPARDASVGVSELDVAARLGLIAVLARAGDLVSSMQEFSVPLERVTSGSTEYWRLRFRIALGRGRSAVDGPGSFFVQGRRDGQITRPRAVQVGD